MLDFKNQEHRILFLVLLVSFTWMLSLFTTSQVYALTTVNSTTSVTVSNSGPSFTVNPYENPASTASIPTNAGTSISFNATGLDENGDSYYMAICGTNSITPNNNAAPSCASLETVCVSGETTSGTAAACNYTALTGDPEVIDWYGFVCDKSSGSICSSASQGTGDSGSPVYVNHAPVFSAIGVSAAADPGQSVTFSATGYDNDVDTLQDSVHLIVCSAIGASSSGCTIPGNQLCASGNVTNNPSCSYTTPSPLSAGNHAFYAYVFDQHGLGSVSNYRTGNYVTNNIAPSLSNLVINSGNAVNLAVSTTTAVPFTFSISDANGYTDVNSINAKFYRTGVGSGAADNANNHYTLTSCTRSNQVGATADYACGFNVQYHADPTDTTSTQFFADTWTATATITDGGALQATGNATAIEMNSLLGIAVGATINYGSLVQGENSNTTNQTLAVSTVGNTGVDTLLKGTDMDDGLANIIPVTNQKYSLIAFDYDLAGTTLTASDVQNDIHVTKTTVTASPSNKNLYWGISIPTGIPAGNYTGTNTITGIVSDPIYW